MPKILAPTPSPAAAGSSAADALTNSPRVLNRKSDRANAFGEVLNGARRRKEPAPVERERSQSEPASSKPTKTRQRATTKRDAASRESEASGAAPLREATRESSSSSEVISEVSDDAAATVAEEKRVDAVDQADDGAEDDAFKTGQKGEEIDTPPALEVVQDPTRILTNPALAVADTVDEQDSHTMPNADSNEAVGSAVGRTSASATTQLEGNLTADPLSVTAVPMGQPSGGTANVIPSDGVTPAAPMKRAASPTSGAARPLAGPAVESTLAARPQAKEYQADASLPPVASNVAATVEAVETADTNIPTAAPHAASAAAPDASAASRGLENLVPQHTRATEAPTAMSTFPQATREARFAEDNHPTIVAGVRGQLMPDGGTMHIRLDPPELGPLAVTVRLHNGVMEASFETSNDEAAKLLSHSLGTLKTSLESQGVQVERLHVQQGPRSEQGNQQGSNDRESQQGQSRDPQQEHAARQDHQRREMLRRMWRKLTGAEDPLDMVA